jgi:hypothetical protein
MNAGILGLGRLEPALFAGRGLAPLGYAAFAFALGALAGMLLKRAIPAMALTLVIYVFVQIAMPMWVRPHLMSPVQQDVVITTDNLHGMVGHPPQNGQPAQITTLDVDLGHPGSWVRSQQTVDHGHPVTTLPSWMGDCLQPGNGATGTTGAVPHPGTTSPQQCEHRVEAAGYRQRFSYHPADQYWPLQWRETGLLLAGTAALVALCFRRVQRIS